MTNSKTLTPEEIAEIKDKTQKACLMVSALCLRKKEWIMSIPPNFECDPDLVIYSALDEIPRCLDTIEAMQKEIEGLESKTQHWQEVFINEGARGDQFEAKWKASESLLTQAEEIVGYNACLTENCECNSHAFLSALKKFRGVS